MSGSALFVGMNDWEWLSPGGMVSIGNGYAGSLFREHGWAKIFLLTCRLKYEHKDAKGILIDSITTDPLDYNAQEPWLFNNVKVVFSLNQKKVDKDDEKYEIKDARVVVSKPSNLLNVYDPNSVQPFASAVVDELNRKYQEVHF